MKYTSENIINNPKTREARACIFNRVYYSDFSSFCLDYANEENLLYCGRLMEINEDSKHPFVIEGEHTSSYIIPVIEDTKKYVPFSSLEELVEAYDKHRGICDDFTTTKTQSTILRYGMWLWSKGHFIAVGEMNQYYILPSCRTFPVNWKDLCEEYRFLDGSRCGKEVKE